MERRSDGRQLLDVVDRLYASVLDDSIFPVALSAVADYAGARGTFWLHADRASGRVTESLGVGTDPAVQLEYDQHYGALDVRIPPSLDAPLGHLVTEDSFLERADFQRSEIYNDFLVPHDIPHILAVWASKTPTGVAAVSLQRNRRQGRFTDVDKRRLAPVIPHLLRSLQMRSLVEPLRQQHGAFLSAIDRMPFGVIFIDASGLVSDVSGPAQRILQGASGLTVKHKKLSAQNASDDAALQRLIRTSIRVKPSESVESRVCTVRTLNAQRPLKIFVIPLRQTAAAFALTQGCAVVVFGLAGSSRPDMVSVARSMGLTHSEASLACALFSGLTLIEAANQLGLSLNTCKSQLKAIYIKTDCRSHVDLAKAMFAACLIRSP
jgi:DNA-binding CsgD family transcriptional regulator